jgi:hypothetical protein
MDAVVSGCDWSLVDRLPAGFVSTSMFDAPPWLRLWERQPPERVLDIGYVCAGPHGAREVLPLYLITESAFWRGYELQSDVPPLRGELPMLCAGSTYSMYTKRGAFSPALARGAWAMHERSAREGRHRVLVVPNLTPEGVEVWLEAVGPPSGKVLLDRTYHSWLAGSYDDYLALLPSRLRRDVVRRLRQGESRGLQVTLAFGDDGLDDVDSALRLVVGTTDEHDWPPLYDSESLRAMVQTEGSLVVTARAEGRLLGAFFGFVHDDEVVMLCGGVHYPSLPTYSTYVALMYRSIEWAHRHGYRRFEWGRDNYDFKERHRLVGTDLWGLVYEPPGEPPRLTESLARMHDVMERYIRPRTDP